MFQNLYYAVKRRMIDEIEGAFAKHPSFSSGVVKVYNKFPYQERVQYGVELTSISSSMVNLSADNYLAEHITHVKLAKDLNYPGFAIEWAKENAFGLTEYVVDENVSSQLDPTQRMFYTSKKIYQGFDNLEYSHDIGQVVIKINGEISYPEFVDGSLGLVILPAAPAVGDVITISYYTRRLAPAGIYVIDFIEDNQFLVAPIYTISNEVVVKRTTGLETVLHLDNQNVDANSEIITIRYNEKSDFITLVKGVDYSITYSTGIVTLLLPIQKGYQLLATYRYQPTTYFNGPYTFSPYTDNHEAIPGVVIAIGGRARKGDRQAIIVTDKREPQAKIYGGHWDISISMTVISKDSIQVDEMSDWLVSALWEDRRDALCSEGLTLNLVEPSDQNEEAFIDVTGDLYYKIPINVAIQSDRFRYVPYLGSVKRVDIKLNPYPVRMSYQINDDGSIVKLGPDPNQTVVGPLGAFEKIA